jgi:hypothetical protein
MSRPGPIQHDAQVGPEVRHGAVKGCDHGPPRMLRLRYDGRCGVCGLTIFAGNVAQHDPCTKRIRCQGCVSAGPDHFHDDANVPGRSAQREYERRAGRHHQQMQAVMDWDRDRRKQIRAAHPLLGWTTALIPKPTAEPLPQHVTAWKTGAHGERRVGDRLNAWASASGGYVLHDRRLPGGRANIDHIAVSPSGVWVIDTKEYRGKVEQRRTGWCREPELWVAGRPRTALADIVLRQMRLVGRALDLAYAGMPRPPVSGVLCFTGATWPLLARPFVAHGVGVAWPAATVKLISPAGLVWNESQLESVAAVLTAAFPPA